MIKVFLAPPSATPIPSVAAVSRDTMMALVYKETSSNAMGTDNIHVASGMSGILMI